MNLGGNTVLVTGGSTGIGLAIAERFLAAGSEVIVCGRRADKLQEAKQEHPKLHTRVCDVGDAAQRVALVEGLVRDFPKLNVLVNNAGIQRRERLTEGVKDWEAAQQEIAINLEAPIHLSMLLVPHLRAQASPAILNVSSGLAFAPMAGAATYCATKAALHSFTQSLRVQTEPLGITVVEIVPPAVNTDLGGPGLHTFGAPLDEFADSVMQRVAGGELEVGFGMSEEARKASRAELDERVKRMANVVPL
ncbi:MAG TPA: SDR family NAD(P)-dependent oxidoreductase [Oscillatoriaceae cyanobacterium]